MHCNFCLNPHIIHGDMKENLSGCFFLNTVYTESQDTGIHHYTRLTAHPIDENSALIASLWHKLQTTDKTLVNCAELIHLLTASRLRLTSQFSLPWPQTLVHQPRTLVHQRGILRSRPRMLLHWPKETCFGVNALRH